MGSFSIWNENKDKREKVILFNDENEYRVYKNSDGSCNLYDLEYSKKYTLFSNDFKGNISDYCDRLYCVYIKLNNIDLQEFGFTMNDERDMLELDLSTDDNSPNSLLEWM